MRKADPMMKYVVANSEAFKRASNMQENALHPSLMFFAKDLNEHQVQKCIGILQGDKLKVEETNAHNIVLRDIGYTLTSNNPNIYLMFSKTTQYSWDTIPGFITVPYEFAPKELQVYINSNIDQCR